MADDIFIEEVQANIREAGKRLRASYNMLSESGMLDKAEYKQLDTRLTIALALVEDVYSEVRRRAQRNGGTARESFHLDTQLP